MGKSWNIPRFDVYDPSLVLYAPLWRPDMVARGGAIKNGTGALSVSPLALAVGANTITVSTAGTFIVNMPEGGTVASGTMTVTGSPVTVSAGIATTITTTGATGNITVTSSNIIRSRDRNYQAITVTGATWGSQGRTFDGGDDRIVCPFVLDYGSSDFTILAWVKTSATTKANTIWSKTAYPDWTSPGKIFRIEATTGYLLFHEYGTHVVLGNVAYNDGKWHLVGVKYNDTTNIATLLADGEEKNSGAAFELTADTAGVTTNIGAFRSLANTQFQGVIGGVWIYNRSSSLAELKHIYQTTKWRYQ